METIDFPVTFVLIAANCFFSFAGFASSEWMNKNIMWPYVAKRKNEYYRFISSGFLHANFIHLFFNMFTLYFFGRNIEMIFSEAGLGGKAAYLALYFSALIISDLSSYFKNADNPHYRTLGASGAVSAIVFASIVFSPWSSVYLYGAIKLSALLFAVLYVLYCVYMGKNSTDNVNHDAHLWGALYGLAFTLILIFALRPELYSVILEQLKHPKLFGY